MKTELPSEILFSLILPRLPAKYVSRFNCVSKQWNSFLRTPYFSKIHLHHVTNDDHQNHHKFLFFSSSINPKVFHNLDCETPHQEGLPVSRSLPFEVGSAVMMFITSFNGLVCVGINEGGNRYEYSNMIIWNPCTGDYKTLFKPNSREECYQVTVKASGLYYCASEDDYRLLRVTTGLNVYIYSLKSDSWRMLDSMKVLSSISTLTSETWGASTLQNENLYFLTKRVNKYHQLVSYCIIMFDTKTEKFKELPTPSSQDDTTICLNSVLLHKDQLIHLCEIYSFCKVNSTVAELSAKLWRIDGDGDGDWTKVGTYAIPRNFYGYEPLHLMSDGNWATLCRSKCHVYKLDPDRDFEKISHRIDNPPKGKYVETLVSPNR
ncbi:unnamed protein product [Lactuca saligna]|uniref:F-box associated beta-propeller type 1 domain-containing protein n=1 Tax=Lactuca saligna TaxID=75948 RepID=A0AA35Z417_LACSI|nr:unnamed protein product [Lactuca saligna]